MREEEWEFAGGSLYYERKGESIEILRLSGTAWEVSVPESIGGYPVKTIGKKAFLSRKNIRRIVLPDTVEEVGDWAFAYCDGLEEICLPRGEVRFGKAVFLECGSLRRIGLRGCPKDGTPGNVGAREAQDRAGGRGFTGEGELLAAAVTSFDAYYLLEPREVGSGEWMGKWDARLTAVLRASDREGYSRQVLCGEEDYGSTDMEAYESGKRQIKVRLALLRLLFPEKLSEDLREELRQYLLGHTKGCRSEETWQVILREHGHDRAYYGLFAELGCVTAENLDGILADAGGRFPEMAAFFLRYREEKLETADFFAALNL